VSAQSCCFSLLVNVVSGLLPLTDGVKVPPPPPPLPVFEQPAQPRKTANPMPNPILTIMLSKLVPQGS
jgi:hypothetical protein